MTMTRWLVAIASTLVAIASARGSTVMALDGIALYDGSERVIEGTVSTRTTIWNTTHTGLETVVTIGVSSTLKGPTSSSVTVVVPGGELDGGRHIVVGMPSVAVGEQARWFLRQLGDGRYRVYGWAQGKWPARTVNGTTTFEPAPLLAEHGLLKFTTNNMVWPAAKIPVEYRIQTAGSGDLTLPELTGAIDAAFATWEAVSCSTLAFTNAGNTTLGAAVDGTNVMLFVETGWTHGPEAAAATSLFILPGQETADIEVNGENFTWGIGPPGSGVATDLLDLQGVMTHEIGHFSGLGHTQRAYDTMYYSWKPWQGQRTLSIDDKLGLCSIYPTIGDECSTTGCPTDEACTAHDGSMLCEGTPDPVGTPCNYDRVECDSFCLFTAVNLSTGYCSKYCTTHADCPITHHCADAMAGTATVKVCFPGAAPPPDAGVGPCTNDEGCPTFQHCDITNAVCTFECRNSEDCAAGYTCDGRGRCLTDHTGGGCCQTGSEPPILGMLGLLLALGWRRRRTHGGLSRVSRLQR